jgi:sec-independent protein translocase protein TatC
VAGNMAKQSALRDRPRPILEHLSELRLRLMYGIIPLPIGFVLSLVFYEPLIRFLEAPARGLLSPSTNPIVTSPTEFMGVTIRLGLITGFAVASPMLIYQIILFIAPAISQRTQRTLLLLLPAVMLLFASGVTLGYFMVLPTMLGFLLGFGANLVTNMIRLNDYLNVILVLLAGLGLAFETPVIMYVLARLRIVSYKAFRRFRKYLIVLAFVIGAFCDPTPNPFDQIVVAGSIIVLYEVGILIAWLVRPRAIARAVSPRTSDLPIVREIRS